MTGFALMFSILLAGVGQDATATPHPFAGVWTVNLSKSALHPDFKVQSVTLEIRVDGDTMTMASRLVNASGQEQRAAETFRTDGTETPGTLNPGIVLAAKWVSARVLDSVAKKDGKEFVRVVYEVSPDGKTLTARSTGTLEQVLVYERQ